MDKEVNRRTGDKERRGAAGRGKVRRGKLWREKQWGGGVYRKIGGDFKKLREAWRGWEKR